MVLFHKELIRKAISKGWELDKFIDEAAQIAGTNLQMKDMKIEEHGAAYKVQNNHTSFILLFILFVSCSTP
jgi:hypothetical protein